MTRRQQFARIVPELVRGSDQMSLAEIYAAVEERRLDLVDDEIEVATGAVRWKHELRWEIETLVGSGAVRRRRDLGRGIYSS